MSVRPGKRARKSPHSTTISSGRSPQGHVHAHRRHGRPGKTRRCRRQSLRQDQRNQRRERRNARPTSTPPKPPSIQKNRSHPRHEGTDGEGVYKITIGRTTKMAGHDIGNTMGMNTWAAFVGSMTSRRHGDFVMLEQELQSVLKTCAAQASTSLRSIITSRPNLRASSFSITGDSAQRAIWQKD